MRAKWLPENLGDPSFLGDHGLRLPYVAGAMANGIASVEMVEAMARAGMVGLFGAAGLAIDEVERAIDRLQTQLAAAPFGCNLIHSPYEPQLEERIVDLYLCRSVRLVSAAAYIDLTLPLVRYRTAGIHRDQQGRIATPNRVMAKVSRVEVAQKFFAPPPVEMLGELVRRGELKPEQAELASRVAVAQDVTAEADSGGHTDNRSPFTLYPSILALRDRMQQEHGYGDSLRVGAAGGIATPHAAAAAFTMGAAYVLTGSVNQACREAGTSDAVRKMLAGAGQGDLRMAPAADMFEMGGRLQVLTRGTMFAMRAQKLYEIYSSCERLEDIPQEQRLMLERTIFCAPMEEVWRQTRAFWTARDASQVERAERDPKHLMALVFRWYLGQSSRWANRGQAGREIDYQIWCGPAMAAFNEWVRGSWLEPWENRRVVPVALNILRGAAVLMHAAAVRGSGGVVDAHGLDVVPLEPAELEEYFA